jgi:hypothetical protein
MINALCFFLFVIVLIYIGVLFKKYKKTETIYLFFVLTIVFGGNRFNGADWINYLEEYNRVKSYESLIETINLGNYEILFSITMWGFSQLNMDYIYFVSGIALINITAILWVINALKIKNKEFILILLFLIDGWTLYQEQLRQSLSVSISLIAIYFYIKSYKYIPYIFVLIAMGFHSSSIFIILIFFLANQIVRNNNQPLPIGRVGILVVKIALLFTVAVAVLNSGVLGQFGLSRLQDKVLYYQNDSVYGASLFNAGLIAYLIGFSILLYAKPLISEQNCSWLSVSWTCALLWCFLGPLLRSLSILMRFEHYLLIFFPFIIGIYFEKNIFIRRRILCNIAMIIFSSTFIARILISPSHQIWVQDYQNIFVNTMFGLNIDEPEVRQETICNHFESLENNFCD